MTTRYKILTDHAKGIYQSSFSYENFLPSAPCVTCGQQKPGAWLPDVHGFLKACNNGYHLAIDPWEFREEGSYRIFLAEGREAGEIHEGNKQVYRSVRLLRELHWADLPEAREHMTSDDMEDEKVRPWLVKMIQEDRQRVPVRW